MGTVNGVNYKEINIDNKYIDKLIDIHEQLLNNGNELVFVNQNSIRNKDVRGLFWRPNSDWKTKALNDKSCYNKSDILSDILKDSNKNNKLKWEGITGIFTDTDGDFTLQLHNQFDKKNKNYFLAHMILSGYQDIKISPFDVNISEEDIFHFLYIYLFKEKLMEAYQSGFYKCYKIYKNNDDKVRGKIDVSRHIKLNLGMNNGKIAYSYRKNTMDNHINQLIIYTYEYLKKKYQVLVSNLLASDNDFNNVIKNLKAHCPSWNCVDVRGMLSEAVKPINHPYYYKYDNVRQLCIKILKDEGLSFFGEDNHEKAKSILFYLPDLWEIYLENILTKPLKEKDFVLVSQEEIYVLKDEKDNTFIKKRPDFWVKYKYNDEIIAVLDAKFKPDTYKAIVQGGDINNYIESDIKQCIEYKTALSTKKIGLLFPTEKSEKEPSRRFYIPRAKDEKLLMQGLQIPDIDNKETFSDWQEKMKKYESAFTDKIIDYLNE